MNTRTLAVLSVALLLASPAVAEDAPDAAALFARETLLSAGDLDRALDAFVAAAKADPENTAYASRAMMLRRVITLRKQVGTARPSAKWNRMVVSLHVYFLRNDLVDLALDLDREAHDRAPSGLTASLLAEAMLEGGKNAEAAALLADIEETWRTPLNLVYRGIANARLGKTELARESLAAVPVDDSTGPGLRYDLARLHVLLGEIDEGVRQLTLSFEAVPPSQLPTLKDMAKTCPDLEVLAKTDALAKVLAVKSKIDESGCSGGSGCGSCPSRGSCGKDEGSTEKKDG